MFFRPYLQSENMSTPVQIKKFRVKFPHNANCKDDAIESLIMKTIRLIQAQAAAAAADDVPSRTRSVTKSVAAPTEEELLVTAMSPEARENFLRDFVQEALETAGHHMDGVSSDPGPGSSFQKDSFASDAPSSM